jgi:hypothetical protein
VNIFYFLISIWVSLAALFLILSFMVRKNMIVYAVLINLFFMSFSYYTISESFGLPKPILKIPLFENDITDDTVLLAVWWNDDNIFLLIEKNPVLLVSIPYDQKLIDQLKNAMSKNGGTANGLHIGQLKKGVVKGQGAEANEGYYGDGDTSAHVKLQLINPPLVSEPKKSVDGDTKEYETQ